MNEATIKIEQIAGSFEACMKMAKEDRKKLHDRIGAELQQVVRGNIASTVNDTHGRVQEWRQYGAATAMLHQGERVLTAAQNREYSSYNGGITINIEGLTVREEADIDRIADELHFRIRAAAANYSEVV